MRFLWLQCSFYFVLGHLHLYEFTRGPMISSQDITKALENARISADDRRNMHHNLQDKGGLLSTDLSAEARFLGSPSEKGMMMHRVQEFLEDTTKKIMAQFSMTAKQAVEVLPSVELPEGEPMLQKCRSMHQVTCDPRNRFRKADGSCNNLRNPGWGRAFVCYDRLLSPDFADGISSPRMSVANTPLPSSRLISCQIHNEMNMTSPSYTLLAMQWGQFIDHDMAHAASQRAGDKLENFQCCPMNSPMPEACYSIELPKDDDFFADLKKDCMSFVRSAACSPDCTLGTPRHLVTTQTSFIDGSVVYDSSEEDTRKLRTLTGGRLKALNTEHGEFLPENFNPEVDQCTQALGGPTCFQGGDGRVNSQPGLTAMHTIWARQHNRIADALAKAFPQAGDEELFQESRRILGAQFQVITYNEFLPLVLGRSNMAYLSLEPQFYGYTNYDADMNPTILTEFASGAYRFGHTLIQNFFSRIDSSGNPEAHLSLRHNQWHPISFYQGKLDSLLKGMFQQGSQAFDRHFAEAMSNHLFEIPGADYGLDLTSINIQRGRDHGLPGYTKFVEWCTGQPVDRFEQLLYFMTQENVNLLRKVYDSVHDVDIYTGGLSERPTPGAMVGPTFGCIIGLQFQKLKFGDRFYFEHGGESGSFSFDQLLEIRKTSLARIICDNSDNITSITRRVMEVPNQRNYFIPCNNIPMPDFTNWMRT